MHISRLIERITAASLVLVLASCSDAPQYDVVIRNGAVVDLAGSPTFSTDIAIVANKIAKIGNLAVVGADRTIDATGLTVAPGFIDLYNHANRIILASIVDTGMSLNLGLLI